MIDGPSRIQLPVADGVNVSAIERQPDQGVAPDGSLPVLLVHGLASNARIWDGVGEELRRLGHVSVAVDQRGHGRSDKPDTGYDFGALVTDLVAVMDGTGLDRPVVVGQSWGANVVLELAVRQPHRVAGVVCVDGGMGTLRDWLPDWATAERALTPPDLVGTPGADVESWFRTRHADWPESGIVGTLANFRVRDDGTVEPWLTRPRHMTIARRLWEHDPVALYPRIGVPILLLVADTPHASPGRRHAIEAITASGADVRVTWFRDGHHDLHAQQPERVAALIADLANEVAA